MNDTNKKSVKKTTSSKEKTSDSAASESEINKKQEVTPREQENAQHTVIISRRVWPD